ncbi:MAG: tetratricopeptide repeat-containing sensor histidine kinase [Cryomorphaceae bacterium]
MSKQLILLIAFTLSALLPTHAQTEIDSVRRSFEQAHSDSAKIWASIRYAALVEKHSPDSAYQILNDARMIAKPLADSDVGIRNLYGTTLMRLGVSEVRYRNNQAVAEKYLDEARAVFINTGNYKMLAGCFMTLGIMRFYGGDHDEAMRFHSLSLKNYTLANDSIGVAGCWNNIGLVHSQAGRIDEAIEAYRKSIAINELLGFELKVTEGYNNVGALYTQMEEHEQAIKYYNDVVTVRTKLGDSLAMASGYSNLGSAFMALGNLDTALFFYQKSVKILENFNDEFGMINLVSNIGLVFYQKDDAATAKLYFEQALEQAKALNLPEKIVMTSSNLAMVMNEEKNYDASIAMSMEALKLSHRIGTPYQRINLFSNLSTAYEGLGDAQNALAYLKRKHAIHDSLVSNDNKAFVARLQREFEAERAQKESKLQEIEALREASEASTQRNRYFFLIGGLALALIVLVFIFRAYRVKVIRNKELNLYNLRILEQKKQIELQAAELRDINLSKDKLFSIVSHDLRGPFSALKSILDLVHDDQLSEEEAQAVLKQLRKTFDESAGLLENLLHWSQQQLGGIKMSLKKQDVKNMLDRVILMFDRNLSAKELVVRNFVEPGNYVLADKHMLELVLRNLLANAIKFSYRGGVIEMLAFQRGKTLHISVRDQGIGLTELQASTLFSFGSVSTLGTENEKGTGLGLALCKDFIERQGGEVYVVPNSDNGSTFTIELPSYSG